jgi:hypothetical protein
VGTKKDATDPPSGPHSPAGGNNLSGAVKKNETFKQKILHELAVYWIYVAYLTLVFASFTQYRRLILADVGISYTNYGVALIEALIFAKVIMIGDALHLGRGLEHKPLIVPTVLKTVVFTLFVAVFTLIEHAVKGIVKGKGGLEGLMGFFDKGYQEVLAGALVVFAALIPFFALRELARVLGGEGKILALLFRRRDNLHIDESDKG